ncbi:MAG TPA: tetratricopeptide repeat protein [Kiritimatiellia bacterium]|nr:tetratricopeptide repeat protein [Kiritimatiellia bacterium]
MTERHDIYTKPKAKDDAAPTLSSPLTIPKEKPPHYMAIAILVVMIALLAGVALYFSDKDESVIPAEFEHLLIKPPSHTNIPSARESQTPDAAAIESLLTDIATAQQEPPPTLSPQKMAEAMAHVRSAQQYIRSRDMENAEKEIGNALAVWPDMNIAIRLLGSIYTQRGQFDQAIVLLERSLTRDPFSAETLNNLAINYMQKGMMAKAEELLITSLQIRPEYGVAYINLGFVHLRQGRHDLAAENFEMGLRQAPTSPGVLNNLAVSLIRLGDLENARERLRQLIGMSPERATAYFNMAISYVIERDYDTAMEWIRRGADRSSPSQLQSYLSDSDFDAIRSLPAYQQFVREKFPDVQRRANMP